MNGKKAKKLRRQTIQTRMLLDAQLSSVELKAPSWWIRLKAWCQDTWREILGRKRKPSRTLKYGPGYQRLYRELKKREKGKNYGK